MTAVWKNRIDKSSAFRVRSYSNGTPLGDNGRITEYCREAQLISTEGHAFQNLGRSKNDIGGDFTSQKVEVHLGWQCRPQWVATVSSSGAKSREYFLMPLPHADVKQALSYPFDRAENPTKFRTWMNSTNPLGFRETELTALGSEAINRMSPLNPVADVSTSLAEFISERKLFSIPGRAGSVPGEYLNYQFGIAPSLSFAQDLRKAMKDQEKIIAQAARDSGRRIRRDGVVFEDKAVYDLSPPDVYDEHKFPVYLGTTPSTQLNTRGKLEIFRTVERKSWFSGAFTYYLPKEGLLRTVAELDAVYGIQPGLDTAWELMPFSWLVDYVSSAGSAIGNMAKFLEDGLIMHYGYIMGQQTETTRYSLHAGLRDRNGSMYDRVFNATIVKTTKQRKRASPFGFGILPGDLSPRQLSILAALGMTYLK